MKTLTETINTQIEESIFDFEDNATQAAVQAASWEAINISHDPQKNGCDALGNKIEVGDLIAIAEGRSYVEFRVVSKVTPKQVFFYIPNPVKVNELTTTMKNCKCVLVVEKNYVKIK